MPAIGNVVVLPGILGSNLADGAGNTLWIDPPSLTQLALAADGVTESDPSRTVTPTTLNIIYDPLTQSLQPNWNVLPFPYDWRQSVSATAKVLAQTLRSNFPGGDFHLIAHSMGGLIARIILRDNPGIQQDGGKLIMLATPNHGAWITDDVLKTGGASASFLQSIIPPTFPLADLLAAAQTWPAAYQLLPCPARDPRAVPLYKDPPPAGLSATLLASALALHGELDALPGTDSMFYIAGAFVPTLDGDPLPTLEGDGVVSHRLGLLQGVRSFKTPLPCDHLSLPGNSAVLKSITPLLLDQTPDLSFLEALIPITART